MIKAINAVNDVKLSSLIESFATPAGKRNTDQNMRRRKWNVHCVEMFELATIGVDILLWFLFSLSWFSIGKFYSKKLELKS